MATEAACREFPQPASRDPALYGRRTPSPPALDVFRDSDKPEEASCVRTPKAGRGDTDKDVPPLPLYALTPKPVNVPPPPTFNHHNEGKAPNNAAALVQTATSNVLEKCTTEGSDEQSSPLSQQSKSKSKRLVFGKKELENEPLPDSGAGRPEVDVQRSIAEQKRQDLARLQAILVTPPPKPKTSLLSLFSRSKKLATPTPTLMHPDTPSSVATTIFSSRANSIETASNPDSTRYSDPMDKPVPISIQYPQTTPIIPVPRSSERRVAVRYQSSTINLAVSLETNAVDILHMASAKMRHNINPNSSVVVESYLMLGLERRLRRYERIRDVMNTWDQDHENSLLILSCPASMTDRDLDIDAVPSSTESPPGFTLPVYQSSRPGKWNKRWVTLLENGQMYSAKTGDALPGDAGCMKLCQLSDFDIYSPNETEIRRSVRPPKQFCCAIKSQQKSMLFSDEVNFVHFFSTDDEEVAARFYERVHGWRSWHLVAKKLAIDRKMNAPAPKLTLDPAKGVLDASADDGKPYSAPPGAMSFFRIDSFKPLLDVNNISKLAEEARKLQPAVLPRPVTADGKYQAHPPPPDFPPPATPAPKDKELPAKPNLKRAETDKYHGSPPNQPSHSSPSPLGLDHMALSSPPADSASLGLDAFGLAAPEEKKSEATSWFPSATEHTAKLRKDEPPPSFRRPATADPALQRMQQRRANNPPPLSINTNTHFLAPPRPFEDYCTRSPKASANAPPIYKLPGTPMMPSAPRARTMTGGGGGGGGGPNRSNYGPGPSPRSRGAPTNMQGRRHMPDNMPPVPPIPNRPMRRDMPSAPTTAVLSVQPRYPPAQRGPAQQPFPVRQY